MRFQRLPQIQLHHRGDRVSQHLLDRSPSLKRGYLPGRALSNPHLQIAWYVIQEATAPALHWELEQRLIMRDRGTVSLQWFGLHSAAEDAPVLVVLPTITGNGNDLRAFVRSMHSQLRWPVVVCNRRGHEGLPMTAPRFNTLGDTEDLRAQLRAIQARRPKSALFAAGLSAGSGLLVRYLGEEGARSKLQAGVVFCPAYDIEEAFSQTHPIYSRLMARRLRAYFLERNRAHLESAAGFSKLHEAQDLVEFHEAIAPLAGFESRADYLRETNPMVVAHDVRVPMLVINAKDDPVCSVTQVYKHGVPLSGRLPGAILALTANGAHCAFHRGWTSRRTWAHRVMVEYFQAAAEL